MTTARDKIQAAIDTLGLTVRSEFVPFNVSRHSNSDTLSLNWRVTLVHNNRDVLTTDYSAGVGNCPSFRLHDKTLEQRELVKLECHHGARAVWRSGLDRAEIKVPRELILPDVYNVVASLVDDADAINYPKFEAWAEEHGYDTDSRAAEATYRACLEIGLALRAALGEAGLRALTDACREF